MEIAQLQSLITRNADTGMNLHAKSYYVSKHVVSAKIRFQDAYSEKNRHNLHNDVKYTLLT